MPVYFVMQAKQTDTGDSYEVSSSFSDEDWELLLRFRTESIRLRSCKWVADGLPQNFKIRWNPPAAMEVIVPDRPDDAAVAEVLLRLRPFILDRESFFYHKAAKILSRTVNDSHFRKIMRGLSDQFSGKDFSDQIKLFSGNASDALDLGSESFQSIMKKYETSFLQLNSHRTFQLWLNAFEFHLDEEKRAEYIRKSGGEPDELALAVFRSMIAGKVMAVLGLASIVTQIEEAPSTRRSET